MTMHDTNWEKNICMSHIEELVSRINGKASKQNNKQITNPIKMDKSLQQKQMGNKHLKTTEHR